MWPLQPPPGRLRGHIRPPCAWRLLVTNEHVVDRVVEHRVVRRKNCAAGITENRLNPFMDQTFPDNLRASAFGHVRQFARWRVISQIDNYVDIIKYCDVYLGIIKALNVPASSFTARDGLSRLPWPSLCARRRREPCWRIPLDHSSSHDEGNDHEYYDAGPEHRSGPRNLDSGLSEISIVFQAAVPTLVASKYTTSGVRRPSEL